MILLVLESSFSVESFITFITAENGIYSFLAYRVAGKIRKSG